MGLGQIVLVAVATGLAVFGTGEVLDAIYTKPELIEAIENARVSQYIPQYKQMISNGLFMKNIAISVGIGIGMGVVETISHYRNNRINE